MALTISSPVASLASTSNVTSYAMTAFTPTANTLLVVLVFASDTVAASSMTGGSLTWTKRDSIAYGASSQNTAYIYTAPVGSSPVSTAPTFDCTGDAATGCIMHCFQVAGYNSTAASPVVQTKTAKAATANPSVTVTAEKTDNGYIAGYGDATNTTGGTKPTNWTLVADSGYNTPASGAIGAYRATGEMATTVTFTDSSVTSWGMLYIEIQSATMAAAGDTTPAASTTGAVTGAGALAGSTTPAATDSGAMTGAGVLAGGTTPTASTSASLLGLVFATGDTTPAASTSGAMTGSGALEGATTPAASTAGSMAGVGALFGTSLPIASDSGALMGVGALGGTSTPSASTSALMAGQGALNGTATPAASTTGTLSSSGGGAISGASLPSASVTGTLTGASGGYRYKATTIVTNIARYTFAANPPQTSAASPPFSEAA